MVQAGCIKVELGFHSRGFPCNIKLGVRVNKKNNFFKKKICTFHGKHVDKSFIYRIFNKKIKY